MASLFVEFDENPLERVPADLLVVGFSSDDRPLGRGAGRADWRLCGELWQLVRSKKLNGSLGEAALLTAEGALRSPLLLVLGLGPRSELAVEVWRELGGDVVRRALDLRVERVVLGLAAEAADLGRAGTHALFGGAASAAADNRTPLRLVVAGEGASERISELRLLLQAGRSPQFDLRLPDTLAPLPKSPSPRAGGFRHTEGVRFK